MRLERVVLVYDFAWVNGGAAQVAIGSALELRRRGVQVDYFAAVGPVDPRLVEAGVTVHCLGLADILNNPNRMQAMWSGVWNVPAKVALQALLQTLDPRTCLVHVHGWTKSLSASIFQAVEASGMPLAVTLHEYFTACPAGGFFDHGSQTVCERRGMSWECVTARCDARSSLHKAWRVIRQEVGRRRAGIPGALRDVFYISEFSKEVLQGYFGADTRWHDVPNPIEVPRRPRLHAEGQRAFLFVGRLSPEKGCDLFLQAAQAAGVTALVAGDGPEREHLQSRWPEAEFLGWQDAAGLEQAFSRARALVFPSLWYETQGLVVQEALARGVPVLVSDRCAARDAVREGANGLLIRQGSLTAWTDALATIGRSDSLTLAMSEAAYAGYWTQPPSMEAHGESLLRAYGEVMARHHAA